jgi:hypothetical protein
MPVLLPQAGCNALETRGCRGPSRLSSVFLWGAMNGVRQVMAVLAIGLTGLGAVLFAMPTAGSAPDDFDLLTSRLNSFDSLTARAVARLDQDGPLAGHKDVCPSCYRYDLRVEVSPLVVVVDHSPHRTHWDGSALSHTHYHHQEGERLVAYEAAIRELWAEARTGFENSTWSVVDPETEFASLGNVSMNSTFVWAKLVVDIEQEGRVIYLGVVDMARNQPSSGRLKQMVVGEPPAATAYTVDIQWNADIADHDVAPSLPQAPSPM